MNAYELNKFIGAILGALVFVMGLSVLSDMIFTEDVPETPAYQIAVAVPEDGEVVETPEDSFAVLLASADPAAGEATARVCAACHSFEEGGANKIGPGLYGVVGHPIASHEGFSYSAALTGKREEVGEWSYEALDGFLENPQGWAPGTIMGYAGVKDDQQRANVIAYLRSISPDAPPLPEPEAAPAQVAAVDGTATDGAEGAAEGGAAAGGDPFTQLVASADPATGRAKAAVCLACHSIEEGAANKIGPNIHGVFGRPVAGYEYDYSPAMRTYAEAAGEWDVEHLNAFLEAPMEVVPGTKMAYAGVKNEEDRAAIVAWLHSISPAAGPIVAAATPAATEAAAPAAAEAAAPAATEGAGAAGAEAPPAGAATEPADDGAAPGGATAERAAPAGTETVVVPEAQGAIPVGPGVEGTTAAGGEGSAPATAASSTAPAAADAATAGEGTYDPQGQMTAPGATDDAGAAPTLSPPAVNTDVPDDATDDAAAAPAAAGTADETSALPAETSLEGAGGREDPSASDGAAAGVADAASDMIEEDATEATGGPVAPSSGAATGPAGSEPAAPAAPAAGSGAAVPAGDTSGVAAEPAAAATPAGEAASSPAVATAPAEPESVATAAPTGGTAEPATAPAASSPRAETPAAPARTNVVIAPASDGRVEIIKPSRASN